jgi:hypothetical protein
LVGIKNSKLDLGVAIFAEFSLALISLLQEKCRLKEKIKKSKLNTFKI